MEATGRDGSRGPWRSYHREQIGSSSYTIGSSSGTVSTSSGTHPSIISLEAVMHFDLEINVEETVKEEQMKRIKSLVQEFFKAPSANCSIKGGQISVLERLFTDLGVGWVLHLTDADGASAGELGHTTTTTTTFDTWSWIRALTEIIQTIRLISPNRGVVGMPSICKDEPDTERGKQTGSPDQFRFALFFQETMSKMLVFVDVIVSEVIVRDGVPVPYMKLSNLLGVHGALSKALSEIWLLFHSTPSAQVEMTERQTASLLSAKEAKAGEAIWNTIQEIWTSILESMEDGDGSSGTPTPQGRSPDIHKATQSVMTYTNFLHKNYFSVAPIVAEAASLGKYVPQIGDVPPFTSLVVEMVSCVQEKLANNSESFTDQGLMFLFLLNNSYFIRKHLCYPFSSLKIHVPAVSHKLNGYMESYIQVSWAPILSCLFDPNTPLCFWRNNSPLSKFESQFQKIYTTQKQWKVPDPELRKMVRRAITKKIIPGYTKYIEDNNITTPKFTPQKLEEMLQELFEG